VAWHPHLAGVKEMADFKTLTYFEVSGKLNDGDIESP